MIQFTTSVTIRAAITLETTMLKPSKLAMYVSTNTFVVGTIHRTMKAAPTLAPP